MSLAQRIMLGQFGVVLGSFVTVLLFRQFIDGSTDFILMPFGLPGLGLSLLVILGYTLWRPNLSKLKYVGLVVLIATTVVMFTLQIGELADRIFFVARSSLKLGAQLPNIGIKGDDKKPPRLMLAVRRPSVWRHRLSPYCLGSVTNFNHQ